MLYVGASVTAIGRMVAGCDVVLSSCPRLVSACSTPQGEGAAIESRPELTLRAYDSSAPTRGASGFAMAILPRRMASVPTARSNCVRATSDAFWLSQPGSIDSSLQRLIAPWTTDGR